VIDKVRGVLYVVALTRAGAVTGPNTGYTQRLHALDLATGADLPESPVAIQAPDFNALMQNQRPALMLANGMVYVGYASHCDKDPYHGFLMAYDAKTLTQVAVFNSSPTGSEASFWQSGQGPAADAEGNVYAVTGNGTWDGIRNFSESFLKFTPQLKLLDWFTPTNHFALDKADNDLNSSGATLIPGTHLVVGGGKEGVLYTLDTRKLGHLGDEHALQHFKATASHLHSLVYWESAKSGNLLYVWGQRDTAKVYKLTGDKFSETPEVMRDVPNEGHPGAMLSLSSNGNKDGILWAAIHATGDSWHESRQESCMLTMPTISGASCGTRWRSLRGMIAGNTRRWLLRQLRILMVKAEHRMGRKAALTANQRASDIDLVCQKGHGSTGVDFPGIPDSERAANATAHGDVECSL
jgi:hypothetical protein